jgi:glucose/arabinose dehydrogenase
MKLIGIILAGVVFGSPALADTLEFSRVMQASNTIYSDAAPLPGMPGKLGVLNLRSGQVTVFDQTTGLSSATPLLSGVNFAGETNRLSLSVAFAPDFATSGRMYISSAAQDAADVTRRISRVTEYTADPSTLAVDVASARTILRAEQIPDTVRGHDGSDLVFAPDGSLFVTLGDSVRPLDSVDHPGQDVTSKFGSVLRIDPTGDDFPGDPDANYAVPVGNPDFGPGADPAIWAIGLRNPFRATIDPLSGRLIIADVGENTWEEINIGVAGANYGWPAFEGADPLAGALSPAGVLTGPAFVYGHGTGPFTGTSITGGTVYMGDLTAVQGAYIFGDYNFGSGVSNFMSIRFDGDGIVYDPRSYDVTTDAGPIDTPLSIVSGWDGVLFVTTQRGELFQLTAASLTAVPAPAAGMLALSALGALFFAGRRRRG